MFIHLVRYNELLLDYVVYYLDVMKNPHIIISYEFRNKKWLNMKNTLQATLKSARSDEMEKKKKKLVANKFLKFQEFF